MMLFGWGTTQLLAFAKNVKNKSKSKNFTYSKIRHLIGRLISESHSLASLSLRLSILVGAEMLLARHARPTRPNSQVWH